MVKLIKNTFAILNKQQTNILSAASVIMVAVALSRVLGLLRTRLLAASFSPAELDMYYAAFRLPNMLFELLVMGSLATAFIPVFTEYLDTKGKEKAFKLATSVINIGLVIFALMAVPIIVFAENICAFLAPGFSQEQIELVASFTKIMTVAQVFPLLIGNFFTGILQSYRKFILPALAPVVYNIGIIIGIVVLTPICGLYAPVYGVIFGAVLFIAIQFPAVYTLGYRHTWYMSTKDKGTRTVGKLMLPRTIGLAVSQIDITIDLMLATLIGAGSVTVFNFALQLQQVPIGLFGASIAQATLPSLSSSFAKHNMKDFRKVFISSFHQILFFVIPFSAILIVLRIPMVRLVFGASSLFDWQSTVLTGQTLAFFSISLFAQSLIHLLVRGFFAVQDTKTPVIIGAISVGINALLSLYFVLSLDMNVWALGLSTSISSVIYMFMLLLFFDRKIGALWTYDFIIPIIKMFLAGLVAGLALYIPIKLLDQLVFDTTRTINLLLLTGISTIIGISVYLFLIWFLDVPQLSILGKYFRRSKSTRGGVMMDTTQEMTKV